jgi:hypothetical protein
LPPSEASTSSQNSDVVLVDNDQDEPTDVIEVNGASNVTEEKIKPKITPKKPNVEKHDELLAKVLYTS